MSRSPERLFQRIFLAALLAGAAAAHVHAQAADKYPGIGRPATPKEIAAWDIDVRPDFTGLPKGRGTVARGMDIWEGKCATCHGTFGESNEVFTPIIGGTTKEDMRTGRVATLANDKQPQRTTMMKTATLSTIWDYINRAMPWNAPKSLSTDDVYAVTAYILNMAEVVPDDFTLSNENIAEVQKRMPNRNGTSTRHGLWLPSGKPDVKNTACMRDCGEPKVTSSLPAYARNAHGNIAEQNRLVGPVRGADTTKPAVDAPLKGKMVAVAAAAALPKEKVSEGAQLVKKNGCIACHALDAQLVGPSWEAVHKKYEGQDAAATLFAKVRAGGSGKWGAIPMPAQTAIPEKDLKEVIGWLMAGPK